MRKLKIDFSLPIFQNAIIIDMNVFSGQPKNVKSVDLTVEDKIWLGREIFEKRTSYRQMQVSYNLKLRTMSRYVAKVRHQCIFNDKSGRPRVIDADGLQSLRDFVLNNPQSDRTQFQIQMGVVFHDSCRRKNKPLTEMSWRSQRICINMLWNVPEDV